MYREGGIDVPEEEEGERRKPDSRVGRMYTDIYLGRGKYNPPITERIALLEDHMESVKSAVKRVERIEWGILIVMLSMLITAIVHH